MTSSASRTGSSPFQRVRERAEAAGAGISWVAWASRDPTYKALVLRFADSARWVDQTYFASGTCARQSSRGWHSRILPATCFVRCLGTIGQAFSRSIRTDRPGGP
jgi:hypothetical protein